MADTLTTLREFASSFPELNMSNFVENEVSELNGWGIRVATALDSIIASMEAQPEPVLYQYRWLNPANNPDDAGLMDWKLVEPRNPHMDTVQDLTKELEAYRYEGKPVYEVRALYTTAQPSEPYHPEQNLEMVQPSEPKAEPAHDDLTIAYMSGFHDGRKAKTEPVQEPAQEDAILRIARESGLGPVFNVRLGNEGVLFEDCLARFAARLLAAPQARKPLTNEQCDAIQRTPQVRRLLRTYADHTDDQSAIALVRAIAQANGIEGGST